MQRNRNVSRIFVRHELPTFNIEELRTDNGRHYITPHGVFPSVTNVLSKKENKGLQEWRDRVGDEEADRVSKEATTRGSAVHDLFERYLKGEEIIFSHPSLQEHFMQVKKVLDKFEIIYANEIPLFSKYLKVAGRCDCVAQINGEIQIVDFKTSKHHKTDLDIHSYKMQCAAYTFMCNEIYGFEIKKFSVIISNLYENSCDVFEDDARKYIKDFWELRKQWDTISTNS